MTDMTSPADAKVELMRLLRLFEDAYSSSRGMPWIGTVRPEQAFAKAADEIERLRAALEASADTPTDQGRGVPASPSGHSRAEPEEVSVVPTSVPNAEYGKYGLQVLDEMALETLAQAIECQGAGNVPISKQKSRLRHALAAFMVRAQLGGGWEVPE